MITIDTISGLATAPVSLSTKEFEAELARQGFTSGLDTEALSGPVAPLLAGRPSIKPHSKYGDLSELLAAVTLTLPSGEKAHTLLTPRSAAGPNLRLLVQGVPRLAQGLDTFTWRIFERPASAESVVFAYTDLPQALCAIRQEVQAKLRPNVVRVYNARQCQEAFGENAQALAVLRFEGGSKDTSLRRDRFARAKAFEEAKQVPQALLARDFPPLQLVPSAFTCGLTASWKALLSLLPALSSLSDGLLHLTIAGAWHHEAYVSVSIPAASAMRLEETLGALRGRLAENGVNVADWPTSGFGEAPKMNADWPTL